MQDQPFSTADFVTGTAFPDRMGAALAALARTARSEGAVLVRSRGPDPLGMLCDPQSAAPVATYLRGDSPPDPRRARVNPTLAEGFRFDQDDFADEELARDPYYNEFLKPHGYGWHANALLGCRADGQWLHLSIKRAFDRGPFRHEDVAAIATHLPMLRAVAHAMGPPLDGPPPLLGPEAVRGRRWFVGFDRRGEVFWLGGEIARHPLFDIRRGALVFARTKDTAAAARMVEQAIASGVPGAMLATGADGSRWAFRLQKWHDRDSGALPFMGIFSVIDLAPVVSPELAQVARSLFKLTPAEARVAAMIAAGISLGDISKELDLSQGTARNHLKAVFAKTGAKRQAELVALLARI